MKDYELMVLFHPDLEMNLDPALDKVRKLIATNGGKIVKEEADGKKRLSYPIKGNEFAVYHFFIVSLPSEAPEKLSTTLNITDEVIRHMVVRANPRREEVKEAEKTEKVEKTEEIKEEKGE